MKMNKPPLDAWRFDETVDPKPKIIWTAAAIGHRIGRSEGYVRKKLAKAEGSPVKRDGTGQLYCIEIELYRYLGQK